MIKSSKNKTKVLVILGPTASGKSDLAVRLAKKLSPYGGAEVISADSRQVYKGLDIGSAKITKKEMMNIPHHLLDIASPKRVFTASQYQKLGEKAINKITKKGKLPIICGGTGFYIDTLVYNLNLPEVPPQKQLRKKLEKETAEFLFKKLKKLDPRRAKTIDPNNKRRLIRALEIVLTTKKPVAPISFSKKKQYDVLRIGIKKDPKELKKIIHKRLVKRISQGMIKEVQNLHDSGLSWNRLDDLGLEYRYVSRYLRGIISKKEMMELIEKESWQYAKRQTTWFKREKDIIWISSPQKAFSICLDWLGL